MSGLEVAGLVLGAFPIALKALEKHREMAKVWNFWWQICPEYKKCENDINFHQIYFNNNIKRLILPLVADQALIQQLLADPGGAQWREPGLAQLLEHRLQDSYHLYFSIVNQLKDTMNAFSKELAVDRVSVQEKLAQAKAKSSSGSGTESKTVRKVRLTKLDSEYQLYRLKFAIGKDARNELVQQLRECNERLEKLLTASDATNQLQAQTDSKQPISKSSLTSAMSIFWQHADRLYKALSGSWHCNCASDRLAKIKLQHRTVSDLEFMLFLSHNTAGKFASSRTWPPRETKIKILDAAASSAQSTNIIAVPPQSRPTPSHRTARPIKSALSSPSSQPQTPTRTISKANLSLTLTPPAKSLQSKDSAADIADCEIQSLCQSFSACTISTSCCGFLQDGDWRFYVYPYPTDLDFAVDDPITLEDLLSQGCHHQMNRRQRYSLALTIASSFVQLRESPWLTSYWSKRDISFFRCADDADAILFDRPYVERTFSSNDTDQRQQESVSAIALLGVVLLELCFGKPIDDHPIRQKSPVGDEFTRPVFDFVAAINWLRDVDAEAGEDYFQAAEWCLLKSNTLPSGAGWRRSLYEHVVLPLERCHQYLNPQYL